MEAVSSCILCVPDARTSSGSGHVARQCVLTNTLCSKGFDARLVLPNESLGDSANIQWLKTRIPASRVIACADAFAMLAEPRTHSHIVFDSYDYAYTASTVGCDPKKHSLVVLDDLAYLRNYPPDLIAVIPDICSRQQAKLIAEMCFGGEVMLLHGHNYILLDPKFTLGNAEKSKLLYERQRRLSACRANLRPLRLLIGLGGSITGQPNAHSNEHLVSFLRSLSQQFSKIDVRCLGPAPASLCKEARQPAKNIGWLDIDELKQAYLVADIFIGSIGYSMWERASLLLPSFVIPISPNQLPYAAVGEELGIHREISSLPTNNSISDAFSMLKSAYEIQLNGKGYFSLF